MHCNAPLPQVKGWRRAINLTQIQKYQKYKAEENTTIFSVINFMVYIIFWNQNNFQATIWVLEKNMIKRHKEKFPRT